MEIPIKFVFIGDREKGRAHANHALRYMAILETMMDFQKLEQGKIEREPVPGVLVTCHKQYGQRVASISTLGKGMIREKVEFITGAVPLVLAGIYDFETTGRTLAKILVAYQKPFSSVNSLTRSSPPSGHFTMAARQFLQVRYLAGEVLDPDGRPRKLIQSLTVASQGTSFRIRSAFSQLPPKGLKPLPEGVVFDRVDKMDNDQNDVASTYYPKPGYKVYVSSTLIDVGSTGILSANYNAERDKLFVVYGYRSSLEVIVDSTESPTASSTISFIVYERKVSNGFSNISWSIESQGTYTVPYFLKDIFVDEDGKIYGPYKPYKIDGFKPGTYTIRFDCVTIDIFSGSTSASAKFSVGNTVSNGKFDGIFFDNMSIVNKINLLSRVTTYNEVRNAPMFEPAYGSSWYDYETYYDGVGSTGGPTYLSDTLSGTYASQYTIYSVTPSNYDVTYWIQLTGDRYGEDCYDISVCAGSSVVKVVRSGTRTHQNAYVYGHQEYRSNSIEMLSELINKKIDEDMTKDTKTDTVSVVNGLVNSTEKTKTETARRNWDRFWDGTSVGFGTITYTARGSYPNGPYTDYDNQWADYMRYTPTTIADTAEVKSIKYPVPVSPAIGSSSFVVWDNNKDGLIINGVRYALPSDTGTTLLSATINDIDVSEKLLQISGLQAKDFNYLGFLF
jgi:hypothetical protein